jgi:ribosome-binding protein aMBF1 (putative translation factor)
MSDDHVVLMCVPTATLSEPTIGSTRQYCELCGEEVWATPTSIAYAATSGRRVMFACTECATGLIEMDDRAEIMPPSPEQLAEMRRRWRP